jgi:ubiquinone/menaquinone biosynthesis C-methylase UbiE
VNESIGNFDEYAKTYDQLLSGALGVFGNENSYYAFRKVEYLSLLLQKKRPQRILDFGCGVGSIVSHLFNFFPEAEIWGTDPSVSSMEIAQRENPRMKCVDELSIPSNYFDVVVVSNVLHHVQEAHRQSLLQRISKSLADRGKIVIFEHNRLNPITRRIVDRCEFDEGVELLSERSCGELLVKTGCFEGIESGYFLFVPPFFKKFRNIERHLSRVPIGAQFWQTARRVG